MALGWKKTIWDLGLVILKTSSWSVVKHGFCGGSGFDLEASSARKALRISSGTDTPTKFDS